uniref:Myb-like domain-containing protein n=3 Tax=Ditylum brightwellii TaxID=49249 RepID=A0A6V2BF89_9STRA|mmetsp:Transcript_27666/g.36752  ORF Transcript_27666/g.36752 Transcript_27666/m.36752 type:complete len:712 (+) Transcript_27666:194-2329(+)
MSAAGVVALMDTNGTSTSSASSANFSMDHHANSTKSEHTNAVLSRHEEASSGDSGSFITMQGHVRKGSNLTPSNGLTSPRQRQNSNGAARQPCISSQAAVSTLQAISRISPATTSAGNPYSHNPPPTTKTSVDSCPVSNQVVPHCPLNDHLRGVTSKANNSKRDRPKQENFLSTGSPPVLESESNVGSQNVPLEMISSSEVGSSCITENPLTQITKSPSHSFNDTPANKLSAVVKSNVRQRTRPRSNSVPTSPSGCGLMPAPTSCAVTSSNSKPDSQIKQTALRRGKWTVEEEAYVARVIQDFNSGFLNAPAGTTLRTYLSEKLHCDPMRITKKFTGDACIGKRVFHPAVRCANNAAAIDKAQTELDALERRWRRRLEMQQRESAKKAAASAAAAAAAASGRHHLHVHSAHHSAGAQLNGGLYGQLTPVSASDQQLKQSVVTQTASWLDRANAILSSKSSSSKDRAAGPTESEAPPAEVENQMKDIQLLIHEGPMIQQTSAGLPRLLVGPSGTPQQAPVISGIHTPIIDDGAGVTGSVNVAHNGSPTFSVVAKDSKRKVSDDHMVSSSLIPTSSTPNRPSTQIQQNESTVLTHQKTQHYSQNHEVIDSSAFTLNKSLATPDHTCKSNSTGHAESNTQWPQDKRPRRSLSANHLPTAGTSNMQAGSNSLSSRPGSFSSIKAAEEEAEALVAFLHCVRASAAASEMSGQRSSG